jgi:hypothetical protein
MKSLEARISQFHSHQDQIRILNEPGWTATALVFPGVWSSTWQLRRVHFHHHHIHCSFGGSGNVNLNALWRPQVGHC